MKRTTWLVGLLALYFAPPAHAHVGNKDVFEQINAGPYTLYVTIRTPTVIPGVATLEVRSSSKSGATVQSIRITPLPLTGEASLHPPTADPMHASADDPAFFTGSLWLMASGSWQVRLEVEGSAGPAMASVPVPAVPVAVLTMQRPLALILSVLGLVLTLGMAGIVAAAVREARLAPGVASTPSRRRRALIASGATLIFMALATFAADKWWNVEAANYAADIYHPSSLQAVLSGDNLDLAVGNLVVRQNRFRVDSVDQLLPDHGHLMHLYAIREPEMDAAFHLHPSPTSDKHLSLALPGMPSGTYKLYADIVRVNGFPETLTATLTIPHGLAPAPLSPEDASATPPPLSAGDLGPIYKLPDGYTMQWDRPSQITANTAYSFRFRLLDPAGNPVTDMQSYLGMAGHAAFVKTDGTAFAHTHPEGSAAMQALMIANSGNAMSGVPDKSASPAPISPSVEFPYGFPSPGRYRIFIQMKHANVVETGVFDAEVSP